MKLYIAAAAAFLLYSTPSFAGAMDDVGDVVGDLSQDVTFGAGIGNATPDGAPDSMTLFYAIADKELDIDVGDLTSSAQVRLGTATDITFPGGSAGIDYFISGLYKGTMELEEFYVYGLAGFSYTSASSSITVLGTTTNTTITSTDFTWGIGGEYEIDRDLKVGVEYEKIDTTGIFAANAYYSF